MSREETIERLTKRSAAAYGMEIGDTEDGCGEGSLQWAVTEAYDAGYRAGLADSRRVMREQGLGPTIVARISKAIGELGQTSQPAPEAEG